VKSNPFEARRAWRASAAGLALAWLTARAAASPELDFGFGARSQALAGAGVALADDSAAVFQNPAGLARARGIEASFGYAFVNYALENRGTDAGLPNVNALEGGLVVPGAIRGVPVAFGFSIAMPDGRLSRLREAEPDVPYWPLDDAGPRLVDVGTGFAARPLRELVVGAGVGFVASLHGDFGIYGSAVAADGNGSEYASNLRHAVDADLTASRFPLLGIGFLPNDDLSFGLAYRGAAIVEHRIQAALTGTLQIQDTVLPVRYVYESRSNVAYVPAALTFGGSYRLRQTLVTAELAWEHYDPFRSPYTENSSSVTLPPEFGIMIPGTSPIPVPPARFHDRFVPRFGVEPRLSLASAVELRLRAGYAYEHSPVPSEQVGTRFLDLDRHVVAGGAGVEWKAPFTPFSALRLDLSVVDAIGVPRTLSTTAGPNADRASGHVLLFGTSLTLVFGQAKD
jgi:long-subunit fatty acid transport protein